MNRDVAPYTVPSRYNNGWLMQIFADIKKGNPYRKVYSFGIFINYFFHLGFSHAQDTAIRDY